jgi:hypothetical protein
VRARRLQDENLEVTGVKMSLSGEIAKGHLFAFGADHQAATTVFKAQLKRH